MDKAARAALLTAKRKDNASENIADYVADLLRQGRASEVTDDLMAQADPQRLHHHYTSGNTGMDLPMDQASRMERAKGMGFDTKAYHGTSRNFPHFSLDAPSATGVKSSAVFSTDNPDVASGYGHSVMPIMSKADVPVSFDFNGRSRTHFNNNEYTPSQLANEIRQTRDDARRYGSEVETDKAYDLENAGVEPMYADEIDAIHMRNINDTNDMFGGQVANHTATLDPTNIRSQFARFDPRLEHLAHLSASTGGAMDFARHVEAVHRAGGQIATSKYLPDVPRQVHAGGGKVDFVKDNPGGEWLESKQARAAKHPDMKFMTGSTTGVIGGRSDVFLPTHILKGIAGLNDEVRTAGVHKYDSLLADAQKNGFDPDQQNNKVVVGVNHYGQPYLLEGNTRVAVAHFLGIPKIKAEVRYWNGAENVDGPMHPEKVFGMASDSPDITKAGGGRIHANGGGVMDLRSKAAQVIRNQPQEKGNVDQMLAMMAAKGVKPSELVNAGRPFGHSVSKEELAKHFEDAVPKVQVHRSENTSGGLSDAEKQRIRHLEAIGPHNLNANELSEWAQLATREDNQNQAKYGQYTLPGGENYREHLLHLPKGNGDTFRSSHWDTPNVLAHLRMKDRDNGKTLHVEEIQSDWGQKGREQGFYDPQKPIEVFHTGTGKTVHATNDLGEAKTIAEKLGPQYDYGHQDDEKVPQGPYVGNTQHWTDLAVKHALTEAAKGGHDRVVFSPGEANADMYGQRKEVGTLKFLKSKNSGEAGILSAYSKDGRRSSQHEIESNADLSKLIGKENAANLLAQAPTPQPDEGEDRYAHTLQGPLKVGGHGMVDYYKNYVHPAALKLLRQHDPSIQPESYDLPNGYKGFALPMTDKARQSIFDNGFQAFKDGGTVDDNEDDGITAYHGSPHSFDSFDISKLGTGEGNQSYGHGLYFAGNEKVAKYYRDALTDPEQTHLHFDQRPVDTPWNEEIRARWPEHFAGKSQRDQDAMEEALGNLSQVNNLKDVPNALSNMSAAAKYMYQRHIKPKLTKPDLGKGHMYKVHLQVKPSELLDWDKPLSEQHPEVQKALNENLRKSNNLKKFMIENPTGGELHEALSDKGSYRDQISASEQLLAAGLKGIKYRDADSRDLSDGDATHNYVMFHHDPIKVMSKYEYGGTVDRALALTRRFTKNGKAATASLKKKPL